MSHCHRAGKSMRMGCCMIGACCLLAVAQPCAVRADRSQLAKKVADWVITRWGAKAAGSVAALARRIEALAARHGHEAFEAVKRIGPLAFHLVEEAGVHGKAAVRLMAQHGERAITWVLTRPKAMALFAKHGDKAAAVLVKHPGIAEPIVGRFGVSGIRALEVAGTQGGRRLAMMAEGELGKVGRVPELLEIIAKTGDRGLNFIWNHKGALATTAALTAFISQPESFITGAKDLAGIVGENVVRPVMQVPGSVATEVARGTNWTLIFLSVGAVVVLWLTVKSVRLPKRLPENPRPKCEVSQLTVTANSQRGKDAPADAGRLNTNCPPADSTSVTKG